jgi:hypothetical protein
MTEKRMDKEQVEGILADIKRIDRLKHTDPDSVPEEFSRSFQYFCFIGEIYKYAYQEYRRRPLWTKIKRRVLRRDRHKCVFVTATGELCGTKTNIVHHDSYLPRVMEGNGDDLLRSVCKQHHEKIHG